MRGHRSVKFSRGHKDSSIKFTIVIGLRNTRLWSGKSQCWSRTHRRGVLFDRRRCKCGGVNMTPTLLEIYLEAVMYDGIFYMFMNQNSSLDDITDACRQIRDLFVRYYIV